VITNPLDAVFWQMEDIAFNDEMQSIILRTLQAGAQDGANVLPLGAADLINWNVVSDKALSWLRTYKLTNLTGITQTQRKLITEAVDDWLQSGQHLDYLSDMLEVVVGEPRAKMIAMTETTRAFAQGNQIAWEASNVVGQKRWFTAMDDRVCPICSQLAEQYASLHGGWLYETKLGEGMNILNPPAHTNCRCRVTPVLDMDLYVKEIDKILGLYKPRMKRTYNDILERGLMAWAKR